MTAVVTKEFGPYEYPGDTVEDLKAIIVQNSEIADVDCERRHKTSFGVRAKF